MDEQELLQQIRDRTYRSRHGITFAKGYMSDIDRCFVGGMCPDKIFKNSTPEQWTKALKDAENTLVYHNPSMLVKKYSEKAPEGYCLVFDAVLTSVTRDRDGDILESKGASVDERMPLLWQHMPTQPIGKMLKIVSQNSKRIITRAGIIDNEFGRDIAKFVKLDALRISHGFKPDKWEEIIEKGADGKDYITGFHIHKFRVFEKSLVSVPSNPDAIIEGYSEEKLTHPVVKQWAKGYYETRPVVVPGWGPGKKNSEIVIPVRLEVSGMDETQKAIAEAASKAVEKTPCSCGGHGKSKETTESKPVMNTTKGLHGHIPLMMPPIEGSWEHTGHLLEESAYDHLKSNKVDVQPYDDVLLLATFGDRAIVCACGWNPVPKGCWSCSWEVKDGKPQWVGEPKDVEITTNITEAAAAKVSAKRTVIAGDADVASSLTEKSWKGLKTGELKAVDLKVKGRMSKKHRDKITDAKDFVGQVANKDDLEKSSKVLLDKGVSLLDDVLTDTQPEEEGADNQPKSISDMGKKLVASLVLADGKALDEAKSVHEDLGAVLQVIESQKNAAEWDKLAAELCVG